MMMNREAWLTELAFLIEKEVFCNYTLAPYRIACGFPSKGGAWRHGRRVGECHSLGSSQGNVHEIFISPVLANPLTVAGTVTHEMAHVAAGVAANHGKDFVRVCEHIGLTRGKPAGLMPGPELTEKLSQLLRRLPNYPHQALMPVLRAAQRPRLPAGAC